MPLLSRHCHPHTRALLHDDGPWINSPACAHSSPESRSKSVGHPHTVNSSPKHLIRFVTSHKCKSMAPKRAKRPLAADRELSLNTHAHKTVSEARDSVSYYLKYPHRLSHSASRGRYHKATHRSSVAEGLVIVAGDEINHLVT